MIPEELEVQLTRMAADSPDREICGFLIRGEDGWEVLPVENIAPLEEGAEFEMDHEETVRVFQTMYDRIIGVYHSHPRGTTYPSWDDVHHAPMGFRYFIVTSSEVAEWRLEGDKSAIERINQKSPVLADPVPDAAEGVRQGDQASPAPGE